MVSKIDKYLRKLSSDERHQLFEKINIIEKQGLKAVDAKPLVGQKGVYRLRVGKKTRLLFRLQDGVPVVIDVGHRRDIYK